METFKIYKLFDLKSCLVVNVKLLVVIAASNLITKSKHEVYLASYLLIILKFVHMLYFIFYYTM